MKRSIVIALILLPAVMLAKPLIKFKSTTVDFGEAASGDVVDVVFEFENAGTDVLRIRNIIAACGCTTTAMTKQEYRPGEKGKIVAKFHTAGYRGKVVKTITVTTNDSSAPEIRLALSGTVAIKDFAQADLKPDRLLLGRVPASKPIARKVLLGNLGNIDLRIIEVSCSPEISLEFKTNAVAPRKSTEIILRFSPFDRGVFNTMVKIRTNDYRNPYTFLQVEAQVD
ncbi:MAG: DUF1573 domain-containing protein [Candidatus Aminicenantes bacterium]|nr:DUF1573 domain-containing protein [Candidatus Aminicenantes bacterium]